MFWRSLGFTWRAADGLEQAGLDTLEDLRGKTGDQILEIPGIGPGELRRCEILLKARLPRKSDYWTEKGLSTRTANWLLRAGIATLEDLARTTREEFLLLSGLGMGSLQECEALLGGPLSRPEEGWMAMGCTRRALARKLARAKILDIEDLRRKGEEDLLRAGLDWSEIDECRRLVRERKAEEVLDADS